MNAVWTLAEGHRDLFPGDTNPGLTATRDALSSVLGLSIDYTTIIDLNGFRSLVNAMGGVDVNVRERIPIGGHVNPGGTISGITGWINAGPAAPQRLPRPVVLPAPAPPPTTSAGCAASGAWWVPWSSQVNPVSCWRSTPPWPPSPRTTSRPTSPRTSWGADGMRAYL